MSDQKTCGDRTEREITTAHHESCTCGGRGPDQHCCPACDMWHRLYPANAGAVQKTCPECDQPMLADGQQRQHEDDYRHASGCPRAESAVLFPYDEGKTTIEVFYQSGDDAWVCGAHGSINGNMIEYIEKDFADNPDEGFDRGDGLYLFVTRWEPPQVDNEGRIELPGYWELDLVGFRPMEQVMPKKEPSE